MSWDWPVFDLSGPIWFSQWPNLIYVDFRTYLRIGCDITAPSVALTGDRELGSAPARIWGCINARIQIFLLRRVKCFGRTAAVSEMYHQDVDYAHRARWKRLRRPIVRMSEMRVRPCDNGCDGPHEVRGGWMDIQRLKCAALMPCAPQMLAGHLSKTPD